VISYYLVITAMDFVKIKEWVRAFAEKNDIWFQTYDEITGLSIDDMQTSYIEDKMFIDINRFHDIKVGYFVYFKEPFDEPEKVSVEERPFFICRLSDYENEEALCNAIILKIRKYMLVVS